MPATPTRRPLLDDSITLLVNGYGFGSRAWRRVRRGARATPLRLLGRPAVLVRGSEAVDLFYDASRIARHGAMPSIVQKTLFGTGSVHSLDGDDHRHRKATFVDVAYEDDQVTRLTPLLEEEWRAEVDAWLAGGRRTAYEASVAVFGRAVMRWAGVPGTAAAQTRWSARLAQIVDGFGAPYSPAFILATLNRMWSDRHAARLIEAVRGGRLHPGAETALHEWAWHRDRTEALLSPRLAGVELQNSMRPMIAVARFVAFAAKELHDRPDRRQLIAAETEKRGRFVGGELATAFAQEVRRTAPFVPMLPAWALTDIEHDGVRVDAGDRVVLDILGTNLDRDSWEHAERFDPDRFVGLDDYESVTAFIPHGGADVETGHRCPGEKLAIAGLASAVAVMSDPRLDILGEGLDVNSRRLPTKPRSGARVVAAGSPGEGRRCPFH